MRNHTTTTGRESDVLSMATSLSRLVPDTDRCLSLRRFILGVDRRELRKAPGPESVYYFSSKTGSDALTDRFSAGASESAWPTFAGR